MATQPASRAHAAAGERASWLPLIAIGAAQVVLIFNVTALKVSIDAIADALSLPASTLKTAIVVYFGVAAALTLPGAKLGAALGPRPVFRAAMALFAVAMAAMAASGGAFALIAAQVGAGIASAALVPALVALVASEYRDAQRARALGWLGALQAMGIVPGIAVAGALATWPGWRYTFGALAVAAALVCLLGGRLASHHRRSAEGFDVVGAALVAAAVLAIGIGADKLLEWGVLRAAPAAPASVAAISPALIVMAAGALLMKGFVSWEWKCRARGRPLLLAPEVLATPTKRSTLLSIFAIGLIGAGFTFLIPLYIEVVQGRSSVYTALALMPFALAGFVAALAVGRLRARGAPLRVVRYGFLVVAAGAALLGVTVRNDWSDAMVIAGLALAGLGEGALTTYLFDALVARAPRPLADDVAPLCGAASSLAAGVGTALMGALAIALLGANVHRELAANPAIHEALRVEVNLDSVRFVSNDRLRAVLARTAATPEQVEEAVRINTAARLRALKLSFFALALFAAIAFLPARRVPTLASAPPAAGPW
ncbi:MAG TPA: MFS transporter [Gammaproteobacteria bacterium]